MVNHSKEFNEKKFNEIIELIRNIDKKHIEISTIVKNINMYSSFNKFVKQIKELNDENLFNKFITKCDIKYELFDSIIKKIKLYKGDYKYKEYYCSEYKLILIFQIKNTLNKWSDLTKNIFYDPLPGVKYHYKYINDQYMKWCDKDIFKDVFYDCVPHNNDVKLSSLNLNDNDDNFFIINDNSDLFIDATSINNKYGSEGIVINPELKKKNITKLSTICNVDGFIYSISNVDYNIKTIEYNDHDKNKKIKTSVNDVKTINSSLNNINDNINIKSINNTIDLIGDKGYITNEKFDYKDNKVNIITPLKKNSKNKFICRNNQKLSFRYIIENTICSYKKDNRINLRKDRKLSTFMGWVYMSCLNHNLNVNHKLKLNSCE